MMLFGHAHLLVTHGIHIIENLNLEELAAAGTPRVLLRRHSAEAARRHRIADPSARARRLSRRTGEGLSLLQAGRDGKEQPRSSQSTGSSFKRSSANSARSPVARRGQAKLSRIRCFACAEQLRQAVPVASGASPPCAVTSAGGIAAGEPLRDDQLARLAAQRRQPQREDARRRRRRRRRRSRSVRGAPMRSASQPANERAERRHAHEHHRVDRHHAAAQRVGHHRLDQRVRRRHLHHHRSADRHEQHRRQPEDARQREQRSARRRTLAADAATQRPRPRTPLRGARRQRAAQRAEARRAHQQARALRRRRAESSRRRSASAPRTACRRS